jgi:predicted amidohydrolase YtcJ
VAIKGNQIIYVGNDPSAVNGEIIDLKGQMLIPGFRDNHTHFLAGGYGLASVQLKNANTPSAFTETLAQFTQQNPGTQWILGGDWDHEAWGGELPNKNWIDSITGNRPVLLSRYDGHMALANSAALKLAKITQYTNNPSGGVIVKDATGDPTGVLKDEAMNLVSNIIPPPTAQELDTYFERASKHAVEHGITAVDDVSTFGGWQDLETYRRAQTANKLLCRVYSFVPLKDWQKLDEYVKKNGKGDAMLHWGALKGFVDGSLGSTTAWFYTPYLDEPKSIGLTVTDTANLRAWVTEADKARLQVTVHAIGDKANDFILTVFNYATFVNGKRDRRFRVEHAQHLSKAGIANFAAQQVIPSMQPYHLYDDGNFAFKRLEDDRLQRTYAFNSLLKAGARLTFGSDWTVAPLDPILGIYAAVTRHTSDGKNPNGWYASEKITVEQALACYTANNAYAAFQDSITGKIKTGMRADITILNKDLRSIKPEEIKSVKVMRTIVDGKEVYFSGN